MAGKLIFISGFSGAGKTTLVRYALETVPNLVYLQTTTTRPLRNGEHASHEYIFVTDSEYEQRRSASNSWDHTDYGGYKYGANIDDYTRQLERDINVIVTVPPDKKIMTAMKRLYGSEPITIWIDTPLADAKARVADDALRHARKQSDNIKKDFTYVFTPTNNEHADKKTFAAMVAKFIENQR
jgi:guanylate kinase